MDLYAGTSGFSYKEWKGNFYPEDLPDKRMLEFYSRRFRAVEVNNTFYRMPRPAMLQTWAAEVPENFKFVIKTPQLITHVQRLMYVQESVSFLLNAIRTLESRLGPLLVQLPPSFKRDLPRLGAFLDLLPDWCRTAVEFRHASWFDDEVFAALRAHNAALCIADADNDLTVPVVATADWGYLRLRRHYTGAQLKTWVKQVQAQPWRDAFVFFKHEESGTGPEFAQKFLELAA